MERNNTYEYSYTIKDIECEINNFFTKTVPGMNSFTGEFFQTFGGKNNTMLCKLFQKTE